jgi:hypothetical protein
MRASWLVLGLGVCAVGALGWVRVQPAAPAVSAGVAVRPPPADMPTLSVPAGARPEVQDPPGVKDKPRPPKAEPGQQGRGHGKADKPSKVAICHRTDAVERPNKTLTVSERAWKAHERHGDTPGACQDQAPPGK